MTEGNTFCTVIAKCFTIISLWNSLILIERAVNEGLLLLRRSIRSSNPILFMSQGEKWAFLTFTTLVLLVSQTHRNRLTLPEKNKKPQKNCQGNWSIKSHYLKGVFRGLNSMYSTIENPFNESLIILLSFLKISKKVMVLFSVRPLQILIFFKACESRTTQKNTNYLA